MPSHATLSESPFALRPSLFVAALAASACAPDRQRMQDTPGAASAQQAGVVQDIAATVAVEGERQRGRAAMDSLYRSATGDCEPAVCAAVARGEILLGMSETQVYAATRSAPAAWMMRRSGSAGVMVPASRAAAPRDASGELAIVQFDGPRVALFGYSVSQGMRVIARADDPSSRPRDRAAALALAKEGDALVDAGGFDDALLRYDRASLLAPTDGDLQFRIARILDVQLRPAEALWRYQRYVQLAEAERGDVPRTPAGGGRAATVAIARQRIAALEAQVK